MSVLDIAKRHLSRGRMYRNVFDTPDGKWVLNDLLQEAGLWEVSTIPGDPSLSAHHDGKRAMALYILSKLGNREARLARLVEEHLEEPADSM